MDMDCQVLSERITRLLQRPQRVTQPPAAASVDNFNADLPQTPLLKTAEELMAEAGHLPPMLVEGLLPDHSLFLLTGKPKAGKSFLALDIADSIRKGTLVLGSLPVHRPGPVIYLALEDGQPEIARRLSQRKLPSPATSH